MKLPKKKVLIVSIIPYFLEKELSWFIENQQHIESSKKTQNFWDSNTLILEKNQKIKLSEVLKKLDEMGYEKVFQIDSKGEFSQKGGLIEIFPLNTENAFRFDFLGNKIEEIDSLFLKTNSQEKEINLLKKKLKAQKTFSNLEKLKSRDYLVHLDHGIGQLTEITKKYFVLE